METKAELSKKYDDLQKQLAEMTKRLEELSSSKPVEKIEEKFFDAEEDIEIKPDKYIKVMSLISERLNLNTEPKGRGRPFIFTHYGEVKRILYSDLLRIIENNRSFLDSLYFIIMDPDVIRKHDLLGTYEKALNKEKIDLFFAPNANQTDAVNLFKATSKKQRESIVNLILDRMREGHVMDFNFLRRLSDIIGYSISEKYDAAKEANESLAVKS
jgi:hypothetical protein